MSFYFRPARGLSVIVLIMLAILIGLGTWQYQRLQWKTELLEDIQIATESTPLTSLADIQKALERDEPVDFRRFEMTVEIQNFERPLRVYQIRTEDFGWRLFSPVKQDGIYTYGAFHTISDNEPVKAFSRRDAALAGYIRQARDDKPRTKSNPEANRWFGFNPKPDTHNWSNIASGADMRFYLDIAEGVSDASQLPVKMPNVRNRHFEYMLTWFSLAFILLVYYVLMHKKQGRIGWS